jgi:hypothetical protein
MCALFQKVVRTGTYVLKGYVTTLIGKGYTYRYTYYNVMSQLYDWNRAHVHAYVLSCYVTTFWLEKGTRTRIRTIMLSHFGKRTYHFGTYYNVMSQLSDWNRAHMCTERTTCVLGGYTAASWEKERMQGNTHLHSRYRPHTTARSTAGTYVRSPYYNVMPQRTYTCTYHGASTCTTHVPYGKRVQI